jgi:hypothetical protein
MQMRSYWNRFKPAPVITVNDESHVYGTLEDGLARIIEDFHGDGCAGSTGDVAEPDDPSGDGGAVPAGGVAPRRHTTDVGVCEVLAPEIPSPSPTCNKCRQTIMDPMKALLKGKCNGSWVCKECNVKCVQLHRVFGRWPPQSFRCLPDDWQATFFADIKHLPNAAMVESHVVHAMTLKRMESEEASCGGKYLPLSVWERKGYDPERIVQNCKSVKELPDQGKVYKLNIVTELRKSVEQMVRSELYSGRSAWPALADDHVAAPAGEAISVDEDADGDRPAKRARKHKVANSSSSPSSATSSATSSSSSSSSSSTSAAKKGKKGKNGRKGKKADVKKSKKSKKAAAKKVKKSHKADKNARAREAKAKEKLAAEKKAALMHEREVARDASMNNKFATRVLAKSAPIVLKLKSLLGDKVITHVADFAVSPARESLDTFKKWHVAAEACLKKGGAVSLNVDADTIEAAGKIATERTNLLAKMLDTARRHV